MFKDKDKDLYGKKIIIEKESHSKTPRPKKMNFIHLLRKIDEDQK